MSKSKLKTKSLSKKTKLLSQPKSKSQTKSIPESKLLSKNKSKTRSKPIIKKYSHEKKYKKNSHKKYSSHKKDIKYDNIFFMNIKPECSMKIQFFPDIIETAPYTAKVAQFFLKNRRHYGQRKLCITELYFMSEYANLSNLVIYVGSAPCSHLSIILDFFPKHIFHLYDSRDFDIPKKYIDSGQVVIYQKYFTDIECEMYKNKNILFISDIRGEDPNNETQIISDQTMQKNWILNMKPIKSMLKFKCLYGHQEECSRQLKETKSCKMEYLDGKLLLQPWAPLTSTETRLIIDQYPKMKMYDCIDYEDKFAYHNNYTREVLIDMKGKSYTWDSQQECAIIRLFKMKNPKYIHEDVFKILNKYTYGNHKYMTGVI